MRKYSTRHFGEFKKKCDICGKEKIYKNKHLASRTCSHKCGLILGWRKRERGKEIECTMLCGRMIWARKGELTEDGRPIHALFCSNKCFYDYRKTIYMPFIKPFPKGKKSWNAGMTMNIDFRIKCKMRAERQWKDLDFREKQMKRDRTELNKIGTITLNKWRKNYINKHGVEAYAELSRGGSRKVHKDFMKKIGVET